MATEDEGRSEEQLGVLLRVAVELAYRAAGTRRYLLEAVPDESDDHLGILEIRDILDGALTTLQEQVGQIVSDVYSLPPDRAVEGIHGFGDELKTYSGLFTKVHEFLMFLPRQPVTPETVSLLSASFGRLYSDLHPSIILGGLFNALEFDFLDLMRSRIPDLDQLIPEPAERVVLQLALCD